ncbi:hypothetical protein MAUB_00760 [Mycolicibacterium aubagnense]|uniref:Uncharacterized protein n=2 Tax=Mycolicibacterium aubagnense TaxID=319707 RepID=A0ABN5YLA2_9MYCO|nr:hypothetical protein C1S80_29440 [Mycolicibacterium aubagnense]BBX82203.1 hypothetical protein MAUB_00760 [Mycolicibacterium aubagnense]
MITVMSDEVWPIPDELSTEGAAAAQVIREFLKEHGLENHGGGGHFYTPQQWLDRGEQHGISSLLIITHDGGDHACAFNLDYGQYELHDQLQDRLRRAGVFAEACTTWYSAIHRV